MLPRRSPAWGLLVQRPRRLHRLQAHKPLLYLPMTDGCRCLLPHDRHKQDVLHLDPLCPKITRGHLSVIRTTIPQPISASSRIRSSCLSVYLIKKIMPSALNAAGYLAIAVTNTKQQCIIAKSGTPGAKDDSGQDVNNTSGGPSTTIIHLRF
jgi:hypothetical protein